jgi:hypothetical protein
LLDATKSDVDDEGVSDALVDDEDPAVDVSNAPPVDDDDDPPVDDDVSDELAVGVEGLVESVWGDRLFNR